MNFQSDMRFRWCYKCRREFVCVIKQSVRSKLRSKCVNFVNGGNTGINWLVHENGGKVIEVKGWRTNSVEGIFRLKWFCSGFGQSPEILAMLSVRRLLDWGAFNERDDFVSLTVHLQLFSSYFKNILDSC